MRFALAFLSLVAAAVAQSNANAFNIPSTGNYLLTAGQPQEFTWSNLTGSTVTLTLKTGSNSALQTVSTIASSIQNTGSYTWTPPTSTPEGADYAIEISDDQQPSLVNYTPQFVIQSNVKAVATSGATTTGFVTATSGSLVTSEPTATASVATTATTSGASAATTGSATATATPSTSGLSTATKAASSAASSVASAASSHASSAASAAAPTSNVAARPVMQAGGALFAVAMGFAVAL